MKLELNPTVKTSNLPTAQRLKNYRNGQPDYYLEKLYYQFGRYLLIASSRPGNMPANLQGIWHNNIDGPWRVDYHNNINIQMNYWPACSTNLDECMLPLIDFIRTLVKPGEKTAQSYLVQEDGQHLFPPTSLALLPHWKVRTCPGTLIRWQVPGWQLTFGNIMTIPRT